MTTTPKASSEAALQRMKSVRQRDTTPEVAVRRALFRRGLRFRVHIRPLPAVPRRADIVFPKEKVAVFVDGCFWHGCPIHGTSAKANAEFWRKKLESNRTRDLATDERLRGEGWLPVRIWEHEDSEEAAARVRSLVLDRRRSAVRWAPDEGPSESPRNRLDRP